RCERAGRRGRDHARHEQDAHEMPEPHRPSPRREETTAGKEEEKWNRPYEKGETANAVE
ncbi:MAG: hypothetical protein QOI55_450, partial [Actinomycetota bacterium]|nr:hypothetical protein [Actinomycetota bacterium]